MILLYIYVCILDFALLMSLYWAQLFAHTFPISPWFSQNLPRWKQLFYSLDQDRTGTISKDELRKMFEEMNIKISSWVFDEWISDHDTNGDGCLSYDEFLGFVAEQSGHWYEQRMLWICTSRGSTYLNKAKPFPCFCFQAFWCNWQEHIYAHTMYISEEI